MSAAHLSEWTGRDASVDALERELARLRDAAAHDGVADLRTSVLTHIAWVPPEWERAATDTLAGLAEQHPSRAILLVPEPDADDGIDAEVAYRCFSAPGREHHVCSEVIQLRLRGRRAAAPASVVAPLLIPDLPVFLRWRGRPDFGGRTLTQLLRVVDRLIVDSREWPDVPHAYAELSGVFASAAVSDIAWARTLGWRRRAAEAWPRTNRVATVHVAGPTAEAHLLAGWLRSRLDRSVRLERDARDELEAVALDSEPLEAPRGTRPTPSELLSAELDGFARDPVYEASAAATVSSAP